MKKINLRDYYPFYAFDLFVDIPDEVAAALAEAERRERNYLRRLIYNKAFYSLDAGDGIEHEALFVSLSPFSSLAVSVGRKVRGAIRLVLGSGMTTRAPP